MLDHEDDDMIGDLITAARTQVEVDTYRSILSQTITLYLDQFPSGNEIWLPRPTLISVTSLTYQDGNDAAQTLTEGTEFEKDVSYEPARLYLKRDASWPSTYGESQDIVIIFKGGYGTTAANVPAGIKQAVKLLLGDYYENRSEHIQRVPLHENAAYQSLVNQFKVPRYL